MSVGPPLREPSYFILAALLDGPLHGYAVIKRVGELSAGRVRLAAGTLYAALDRLAAEELLTVVTEEIVNGRARRYYGVTDGGIAVVRAEAERMAAASDIVMKRGTATQRASTPRMVKPA